MDMKPHEQIAFRVTGHAAGGSSAAAHAGLRSALLAHYRDLASLRYDFPLVLVKSGPEDGCIRSLSGVIDALLQEVAPRGPDGEQIRQHVLRLEQEIRALTARGVTGSLAALWEKSARRLAAADKAVEESLERARAALKVDGKLVDCNAALAPRLVTHAWDRVQQSRTRLTLEQIDALIVKLSDILKASAMGSAAGRSADALKAAVGTAHAAAFDFEVMSRLLARVAGGSSLPLNRLRRIQWALATLQSQRFFRRDGETEAYGFAFDSCAAARDAYRERLPRMAELVKAIAVARLEAEGRYIDGRHDTFFAALDAAALDAEDLALFPDYLVCVRWSAGARADEASVWDLLSSGIPAKVLVQSDEILTAPGDGDAIPFLTARSTHLAAMAVGLRHAYVLQSVSANLLQVKAGLLNGLHYRGPALFSVYSGCAAVPGGVPPYLNAAAAMQSRAFPTFRYDPAAPDRASAFSIEHNPAADQAWTAHALSYEDGAHQRASENVVFTFADFVACDPRYAGHFAPVPRKSWGEHMVPVSECPAGVMLRGDPRVPYVLLVDHNGTLHRAIVDDRLVRETERCRATWRLLQEQGGIRNSHAERLLAREKEAWEAQHARELQERMKQPPSAEQAPAAGPGPAPLQAAPATPAVTPEPAAAGPSGDEPYIETPRCTSCDECTQINSVVFAYDANKQAYIANRDAATYRELVEAAESCQVSIIHPGKPRNPNEPGLDELLKRAEPFL